MCTNPSGPTMKQAGELYIMTFEGTTNPLAISAWLATVDKILKEGIQCLDEDKVMITTFLLKSDGRIWWAGERMSGITHVSNSRRPLIPSFIPQPTGSPKCWSLRDCLRGPCLLRSMRKSSGSYHNLDFLLFLKTP